MSANVQKTDAEDWVPVSVPIPKHWSYVDFAKAFTPISLSNIKLPQSEYSTSGAFPVVDQGKEFIGGYTDCQEKVINEAGSVIVFGDHTKCFKFITFPFVAGADGTKVLVPQPFLEPKYAYFACLSLRLPDRGYSRHYSFLKKSRFPIAPLAEQRRVVAKIEELFSELDKGVESLIAAREQLKAYRQAVLKHAFEGKLTAHWREHSTNLETPEALLSYVRSQRETRFAEARGEWQRAISQWRAAGEIGDKPGKAKQPSDEQIDECDPSLRPEVPECWATASLGTLDVEVFDGPFGSNLKTSDYVKHGVRVIRLENIGYGRFIDEKRSFVSEEKYEALKKHTVGPGDIVFSSFVTDAIRSTLVPNAIPFAVNKADCFAIRVFGTAVDPRFVQRFLESRQAFKQVEGMIHGVGRPRINTVQLKQLVLPICSSDEQSVIVGTLDRISSEIDALDADIQAQLNQQTTLRQAILKKAFSGHLVLQHTGDEPVSVLLKRINGRNEGGDNSRSKNNRNGKKEAA